MVSSELNYKEKLNKTRENLYKKFKDIRDYFAQIEKIKVETIKKTDEIKNSMENELRKIEGDLENSKELSSDSKEKLTSEINILRREIEEKYIELREKIVETKTPT